MEKACKNIRRRFLSFPNQTKKESSIQMVIGEKSSLWITSLLFPFPRSGWHGAQSYKYKLTQQQIIHFHLSNFSINNINESFSKFSYSVIDDFDDIFARWKTSKRIFETWKKKWEAFWKLLVKVYRF